MNGLIGYTGFVGQNLDSSFFNDRYNSKNIDSIRGKKYDMLLCAGVPGHKTLANQNPEKDWESILLLMRALENVECNRFIHISTIDVYKSDVDADEDTTINGNELLPYGKHRVKMEQFVKERFPHVNIIRLPGIFGKGLKKNFIFDLIFKIPRMISLDDFDSLKKKLVSAEIKVVKECYKVENSQMLILNQHLPEEKLSGLRTILEQFGYTSLRFTDSESTYSYYDLNNLKQDIKLVLDNKIHLINMVTEPVKAWELAWEAFGIPFCNRVMEEPIRFHIKSKYYKTFNGKGGYLYSKEQVISQLKEFNKSRFCNM